MYRRLFGALLVAAALAACSEPLRVPESQPSQPRVVTRVMDGRVYRLTIEKGVATMSIDGRPATRVRRDGNVRHVTAWLADGSVVERSYDAREAARERDGGAALARGSVDDSFSTPTEQGCAGEWFAYGAATALALVACTSGPTPPCLAAILASGKALDDLLNCLDGNEE